MFKTGPAPFELSQFITDGKRKYMVTTVARNEAGEVDYYLASYFVRGGGTRTVKIPGVDAYLYEGAQETGAFL